MAAAVRYTALAVSILLVARTPHRPVQKESALVVPVVLVGLGNLCTDWHTAQKTKFI